MTTDGEKIDLHESRAPESADVESFFLGSLGHVAIEVLLDEIPDLVFLKDVCGRYVYANQSLRKRFGFNSREIKGKTDFDLFPTSLASFFLEKDQDCRKLHELVREEAVIPFPFGEQMFTETLKVPLHDVGGEFIGVLGVARDITERKRHMIELETARSSAIKATQAKSFFLANMSHEIRTPLNAIVGLSQVLLGEDLTENQHRYVEQLISTSRLLVAQLSDILDLSKMEAGKLDLRVCEFSLCDLCVRLSNVFSAGFRDKGVSLEFRLNGLSTERIVGDEVRIEQVLTNFIGNSLKFTDVGSVVVTLGGGLSNSDDECIELFLEVKDTGCGIKPEIQNQLFNVFEQGDNLITRKHGGSGLGLSICKGLAELMGGAVGVSSEEGVGSTFWMSVPVRRACRAVTENKPPSEIINSLNGIHVLLVDDNELNRNVQKILLERAGAEVTESCDGRSAIDLLLEKSFDCVLMDMQMPNMGGLEATQLIRRMPYKADIPIIAMTANATAGDQHKCMAAGMDAFVSKPVNQRELFSMISNFVLRRGRQ